MQDETLLQACMRTIIQQTFYQAYWKTFSIVAAETDALREKAFRLRYQVYRADGGFEGQESDANPALIEKDAYDARAVHYLLIHNATGQTAGTVRVLLPGVSNPLHSFELQDLCRHPMLEHEDRAQHLCEISRLCMAWQFRRRPGDGRTLPAYCEQEGHDMIPMGLSFARRRITYAPLGLMKAAFQTAMDRGLLDCVSLMDPADFRSLKRLGMPYKVLGPKVTFMQDCGQQPIIYNIKAVLDSMESFNPECWEVLSDKGALSQRASEIQLENWRHDIFTETVQSGFLNRFL